MCGTIIIMDIFSIYFPLTIVFIFGVIIGSFLNVVIYRLHTGKSLNDRSHCLSCGHQLSWYELFPLLSYIGLWGKCLCCRAHIPSRYFLVEFLTGLVFLMTWMHTDSIPIFSMLIVCMCALIVGVVYDIRHMIIPNEVVGVTTCMAFGILTYTSYVQQSYIIFVWGIIAGCIAFCFYAGLWWFSKGRWLGFGDAKLSVSLGMLVGIQGVFSLIVLSFWIGAFVSVLFIAGQWLVQKGKTHLRFSAVPLTIKSEIPFAPFLIGAVVLVYFCSVDVLSFTSHVITFIYNPT